MVILGIDPGTRRIGYGLVGAGGGSIKFIAAGLLPVKAKTDAEALLQIHAGTTKLVRKFRPRIIAIEKIYFAKNQKTAMKVAEARGAIMLAAKQSSVQIDEYAPNEVKSGITGYGLADKKAVLKMVKIILGKPRLKVIDDASDALALAIVAAQRSGR